MLMSQFEPPRLKPNDYHDYTERFSDLVGDIAEGQYGNYRGRLVLRMTRDQFETKYQRYLNLGIRYGQMLSQSDTIEDSLTVDLRAAEIELLITNSLFLPFPKYLG
jgi:hypothetical protein